MDTFLINEIYKNAKLNPSKTAIYNNQQTVNYEKLIMLIDEKCEFLIKNNIKSIALKGLSQLDFLILDLACLKLNILCLLIPYFFTKEQIDNAIKQSNIQFVYDGSVLIKTNNLEQNSANISKVTFTSGSTGNPKGVRLSTANISNIVKSLTSALNNVEIETHTSLLPYAILLENIAGAYLSLYNNRTIYCPDLQTFTGQEIFNTLSSSKANSTILVPELLKELLIYMQNNNLRLPKIQFAAVGGAKVSNELLIMAKELNLKVFQGYGLSENSSVVALNTANNNKIGSVGKILPHVEYFIAEDNELIIINPQFLGYSDNINEQTNYPTGDIVTIDEDGFLFVTGRKKNLIITSMGRNIAPEWPESLLQNHPQIKNAIVYGDAEKSIKALITLKDSKQEINIMDLQNNVNQKLPNYAQLAEITIVDDFAKNNLLTGNLRLKRNEILNFYNLL